MPNILEWHCRAPIHTPPKEKDREKTLKVAKHKKTKKPTKTAIRLIAEF